MNQAKLGDSGLGRQSLKQMMAKNGIQRAVWIDCVDCRHEYCKSVFSVQPQIYSMY